MRRLLLLAELLVAVFVQYPQFAGPVPLGDEAAEVVVVAGPNVPRPHRRPRPQHAATFGVEWRSEDTPPTLASWVPDTDQPTLAPPRHRDTGPTVAYTELDRGQGDDSPPWAAWWRESPQPVRDRLRPAPPDLFAPTEFTNPPEQADQIGWHPELEQPVRTVPPGPKPDPGATWTDWPPGYGPAQYRGVSVVAPARLARPRPVPQTAGATRVIALAELAPPTEQGWAFVGPARLRALDPRPSTLDPSIVAAPDTFPESALDMATVVAPLVLFPPADRHAQHVARPVNVFPPALLSNSAREGWAVFAPSVLFPPAERHAQHVARSVLALAPKDLADSETEGWQAVYPERPRRLPPAPPAGFVSVLSPPTFPASAEQGWAVIAPSRLFRPPPAPLTGPLDVIVPAHFPSDGTEEATAIAPAVLFPLPRPQHVGDLWTPSPAVQADSATELATVVAPSLLLPAAHRTPQHVARTVQPVPPELFPQSAEQGWDVLAPLVLFAPPPAPVTGATNVLSPEGLGESALRQGWAVIAPERLLVPPRPDHVPTSVLAIAPEDLSDAHTEGWAVYAPDVLFPPAPHPEATRGLVVWPYVGVREAIAIWTGKGRAFVWRGLGREFVWDAKARAFRWRGREA